MLAHGMRPYDFPIYRYFCRGEFRSPAGFRFLAEFIDKLRTANGRPYKWWFDVYMRAHGMRPYDFPIYRYHCRGEFRSPARFRFLAKFIDKLRTANGRPYKWWFDVYMRAHGMRPYCDLLWTYHVDTPLFKGYNETMNDRKDRREDDTL